MAKRVAIFRAGGNLFCVPFDRIQEILDPHRILPAEDLPPESAAGARPGSLWVASRGRFVPIVPGLQATGAAATAQVIVVQGGGAPSAFAVDQVMGIEKDLPSVPFPRSAAPFCNLRYSAVHIWRGRTVLELDLSSHDSLHFQPGLT